MFIMVDSNEGMDRAKTKNEKVRKLNAAKNLSIPEEVYSNKRMVQRLQQRFPNIQQTSLTCGDINVIMDDGKMLAIERKRAGDFLGSIREGHIFKQVENMANHADWSCIVVEGLIKFDKDDMAVAPRFDKEDRIIGEDITGWHGDSVRGTMWAIGWSGCPIITINPHQIADIVESLVRFCQKPPEHSQMLTRRRIVSFPPISLAQDIVSSFPGIGLKRTKALEEFAMGQNDSGTATLGEMLVWGSHLGRISRKSRPEGWGDVTVLNFRTALGLQDGEYLKIEEDKEEIAARKKAQRAKEFVDKVTERSNNGNRRSNNGSKVSKGR